VAGTGAGRILQLSVKPETRGERGLPKRAVDSAFFSRAGVEGDFNRYRTERQASTAETAVLILPVETLQQLRAEGWRLEPGELGENITTQGVAYDEMAPGTQWQAGQARLRITKACDPCSQLRHLESVGQARVVEFIATMLGRRGWYAQVVEEGLVSTGDGFVPAPTRRSPR
jgi:MOSC domain-containing protein YiiM